MSQYLGREKNKGKEAKSIKLNKIVNRFIQTYTKGEVKFSEEYKEGLENLNKEEHGIEINKTDQVN